MLSKNEKRFFSFLLILFILYFLSQIIFQQNLPSGTVTVSYADNVYIPMATSPEQTIFNPSWTGISSMRTYSYRCIPSLLNYGVRYLFNIEDTVQNLQTIFMALCALISLASVWLWKKICMVGNIQGRLFLIGVISILFNYFAVFDARIVNHVITPFLLFIGMFALYGYLAKQKLLILLSIALGMFISYEAILFLIPLAVINEGEIKHDYTTPNKLSQIVSMLFSIGVPLLFIAVGLIDLFYRESIVFDQLNKYHIFFPLDNIHLFYPIVVIGCLSAFYWYYWIFSIATRFNVFEWIKSFVFNIHRVINFYYLIPIIIAYYWLITSSANYLSAGTSGQSFTSLKYSFTVNMDHILLFPFANYIFSIFSFGGIVFLIVYFFKKWWKIIIKNKQWAIIFVMLSSMFTLLWVDLEFRHSIALLPILMYYCLKSMQAIRVSRFFLYCFFTINLFLSLIWVYPNAQKVKKGTQAFWYNNDFFSNYSSRIDVNAVLMCNGGTFSSFTKYVYALIGALLVSLIFYLLFRNNKVKQRMV